MERQRRETLAGLLFVVLLTAIILTFIFSLSSCRAPDRLDVGYGHQFQDLGSVKDLGLDTGDADTLSISVGWNLRPVQVEVIDRPEHSWWPDFTPAEHYKQRAEAALAAGKAPPDDPLGGAVERFDALGLVTKVLLALAACWLGWVYRDKLKNLIPG